MKKTGLTRISALLLAVMMLCGLVFGAAAESAAPADPSASPLSSMNFLNKYASQGQQTRTTLTWSLGDNLSAMVPESSRASLDAVSELLNVLGIQFTSQQSEGRAQVGLDLLLSQKSVLQLKFAFTAAGILVSSNLLGDKPALITADELKKILDTYGKQMVAQGAIPEETWNMFAGILSGDPSAVNPDALIGQVDMTGLQNAFTAILSDISMEAVETAPAKLPTATTKMTLPLRKEALASLVTEFARFFWSIPQLQAAMKQSGIQTEEAMIEKISSSANVLAEDTALEIYTAEDGSALYLLPARIQANDLILDMNAEVLSILEDQASKTSYSCTLSNDNAQVLFLGDAVTRPDSFEFTETTDVTSDGKTLRVLDTSGSGRYEASDTAASGSGIVKIAVQSSPDAAAPVALQMDLRAASEDKGDHAEGEVSLTVSLDGIGELGTVRIASETVPNPEYIDEASAVQPLSMSQEDQQQWIASLQTNLQTVLFNALLQLPEGARTLIPGMGPQQ